MLISNKIKEDIKKEIKAQQSYLKLLENQEKKYNLDLSEEKEETKKSIEYYEKIIKEN